MSNTWIRKVPLQIWEKFFESFELFWCEYTTDEQQRDRRALLEAKRNIEDYWGTISEIRDLFKEADGE